MNGVVTASAAQRSKASIESTLDALARLLVPNVADWCVLYLRGPDGGLRRAVRVGADARLERLLAEYDRKYPIEATPDHPVLAAMLGGETSLLPSVDGAILRKLAKDEAHYKELERFATTSAVILPLRSAGRILGVLQVGRTALTGKRYGLADLPHLEEVANLAALALDNARVYEEAEAARAETARMLAVRARERRRLEDILRQLPVGVLVLEPGTGRVRLRNDLIEGLCGRPVHMTQDLLDASLPACEETTRGKAQLEAAITAGATLQCASLAIECPQGGPWRLSANVGPILDDTGALMATVVTLEDITRRVELENELEDRRELERHFLRIQNELHEGVLVTEGVTPVFANEAMAALTGRCVDDLVAPGFDARSLLVEPDTHPLFATAPGTPEASGTLHAETGLLRMDGTEALVEVASAHVVFQGRPARIAVFRDITEKRRMADALLAAREALDERDKLAALGTLVCGVAHEVRTPLTYIQNSTHLALSRIRRARAEAHAAGLEREVAPLLDAVLEGVDRTNELVRELRRFTQGAVAPTERLALDPLVGQALLLFRATHRPAARLEAELAPTPVITLNSGQVQQIVLNLLSNAADATSTRGDFIRISTGTTAEGCAFLRVEDDGEGIPRDVRARMFEPLVTTKSGGSGLGLAIVRRIVEAHGARIECDSPPEGGAAFTVTFPPAEGHAGPAQGF